MRIDIPKKHIDFIHLVAAGKPVTTAYREAVAKPDIKQTSAAAKGSELAAKYKHEINELRQADVQLITDARSQDIVQNAVSNILSAAEVDQKLSEIIRGDATVEDVVFQFGEKIEFERKPNVSEIARAIAIYYQRFGLNAAQKQDVTLNNIPAPIIQISSINN